MKITIAQRLFPFSHIPGTTGLIPGSEWQIQIFPTIFRFKSLISGEEKVFPLDVQGPVLDFTVLLNLEKLWVEISGHTANGYRHYTVSLDDSGIVITFEKKKELIPVSWKKGGVSKERLSLGVHKQLDWELVCRRRDLKEIFPVWFRLGQITPQTQMTEEGVASLLTECPKLDVAAHFTKIFLAGFKSLLTPRLIDDAYQGIVSCPTPPKSSPLIVLTEGARLIRALFFKEENDLFSFLPTLSPEFHTGRFVQITTRQGDLISFEWSKKLLSKVEILPKHTREISLHLQKALKSFRVKRSPKDKGKRHLSNLPFFVEEGKTLFLDRFEA